MRPAPRIETARLVLRASRAEDLDAHARMLGDPEMMRYLSASPVAREDAWRRLLQGPGLWSLLGYGYWSLARREDDGHIGHVGFADFKRDIAPSIEGLPEIGWLIAPQAQGKGYASEAVAAMLAWADETLNAPEIVALIDPANAPSLRVADKAGFVLTDTTTYKGQPTVIVRRYR